MKVLFISNDPQIFVAESAVRKRMRTYADAIGELHILSRAPRGARRTQDGALTLHPLLGSRIQTLLAMQGRARNIVVEKGIEVVSAQDPFEHGWVALQAVQGTSAKLHIQIHTDFLSPWFTKQKGFRAPRVKTSPLNAFRVRIADRVIPKAHGIRVVSKRIGDSLTARYGNALPPVSVIPVAVVDTETTLMPLPVHSFVFSLITVGRLEPEKRIQDILFALARIQQLYPSVGLFVVGDGRERKKLEVLTRKLGLSEKVVFLGTVPNAQALVKSAHAYIQASAYEGYGLTLIEAALARVPIITTDVGIVGEVFHGYEDVLSAPVGDPAQLAVHISGMVEDHQARLSLAINAQAKAQAHVASLGNQPERIASDLSTVLHRP